MALYVFILTTAGPVRIQGIAEEDPAVRSAVCLDGRAESLPVSAAYDAFVRRPTGVIEKFSGHPAYRMDVDGRIDDGRSWQLGAFIAHAAAVAGALDGDIAVFATGEVGSALDVRPVERVAQKLRALADALPDLDIGADRAVVLVPAWDEETASEVAGIPVVAVSDVETAMAAAGLPMPAAKPTIKVNQKRNRAGPVMAMLLAVLSAAFFFWLGVDLARWAALSDQGRLLDLEEELSRADTGALGRLQAGLYRQWLALRLPDANAIRIEGSLLIAPVPDACADEDVRRPVALEQPLAIGQAVCAIEMRGFAAGARALVGRLAYWPEGLGRGGKAERTMRGSAEVDGRTWTLDFDRLPQPGAVVRLAAVAGAAGVQGTQPWYQDLLSAPVDSAAFAAAVDRLDALGYAVTLKEWRR